MRSLRCVLVVACVARKLRPCPSYNRCRDRINLGLKSQINTVPNWRSLYNGGGLQQSKSILGGGKTLAVPGKFAIKVAPSTRAVQMLPLWWGGGGSKGPLHNEGLRALVRTPCMTFSLV